MQKVVQDVDNINRRVVGILQHMSFEGRAMVTMIAEICVHLGFDPVTVLPKA